MPPADALRFGRRAFLSSAACLATTGLPDTQPDAADDLPTIPTAPDEIRAAFEDVPRVHDPDSRTRLAAEAWYPEVVVPDEGVVPDPDAGTIHAEVVTPRWVLAAAFDNLSAGATRGSVIDYLLSASNVCEHYVTLDGRDAADAILDALDEG